MVLLKEITNKSLLANYIDEFRDSGDLAFEQSKLKIVDTIVEIMETEGVNKAELARRLDKSRAYITQILQGDVNFTIESLVRIATTLNCNLEIKLVRKNRVSQWIDETYRPVIDDCIEKKNNRVSSSVAKADRLHSALAS
jgi:transcriptional regulator with XRE-family HTH domain